MNVGIKGTGMYTPSNVIDNHFFEKVGSSDLWIFEKLGIKERRISEGETTSDLAYKAALKALEDAELQPDDLDLIIVATATPDRLAPSSACFVQEKLNFSKSIPAFDISAVCSGALFAITTGYQFIQSGMYKNVMVIGADTFSTITDWERRDSVFFGDGAGAIILSKDTKNKGFLDFIIHSDGSGKEHFTIPSGGSEKPASEKTISERLHYFQMNGKEVFNTATKVVPKAIIEILSKNNLTINDIDYMIPHQPSIRILQSIAEQVNLPFSKVMTNMDKYANTSGGTIPIMLDEFRKSELYKEDQLLLFAAVGAGWTWGTALYQT